MTIDFICQQMNSSFPRSSVDDCCIFLNQGAETTSDQPNFQLDRWFCCRLTGPVTLNRHDGENFAQNVQGLVFASQKCFQRGCPVEHTFSDLLGLDFGMMDRCCSHQAQVSAQFLAQCEEVKFFAEASETGGCPT